MRQERKMRLALRFRSRDKEEVQYRTASTIDFDGKGNLILYGENRSFIERLTLEEIQDVSISWGATRATSQSV
jgi:hypothetical protein